MPGYFFDTSALAKLYHAEPGSEYVEDLFSTMGSKGLVSPLSLVEMESEFAIKVRTGVLDEKGRLLALRRFRADIVRHRVTVGPLRARHYRSAAKLMRVHAVSSGSRSLDALQLAVAFNMQETSEISVIVSADRRLCEVARICGCPAIDPVNPA